MVVVAAVAAVPAHPFTQYTRTDVVVGWSAPLARLVVEFCNSNYVTTTCPAIMHYTAPPAQQWGLLQNTLSSLSLCVRFSVVVSLVARSLSVTRPPQPVASSPISPHTPSSTRPGLTCRTRTLHTCSRPNRQQDTRHTHTRARARAHIHTHNLGSETNFECVYTNAEDTNGRTNVAATICPHEQQ